MKLVYLTKPILEQLYLRKRLSMQDIANLFGCTRQAILKKMKQWEIPRRGNQEQRLVTLAQGKIPGMQRRVATRPKLKWMPGWEKDPAMREKVFAFVRQVLRHDAPLTVAIARSQLDDLEWHRILAAYRHRCVYCGKRSNRLTQDHILPVSKGGKTEPSNIVPACKSCNSRKGDRAPLGPIQTLLL